MRRRTPFSERQNHQYSPLRESSQTLYEAYKSNAGKIAQGVLEGALGATIAAMSSVADDEMLGIHAALGGIWTAFTTKNFAEVGYEYLHKKEEDIENIGIEVLTYAKLRSQESEVGNIDFAKAVNGELISAISSSLTRKNFPEISEDEMAEIIDKAVGQKEVFESFVRERSAMKGGAVLATIATLGSIAVIGGVTTMIAAGSNATAFNTGIGIAGSGAFLTSLSGGLMNASATNSRNISSGICEAISSLNETKFGYEKTQEARLEVASELESQRKTREEIPSTNPTNPN